MEIHKKEAIYVYKLPAGNHTPAADPPEEVKETVSRSYWGLRRSKTYRENDQRVVKVEGGGEVAEGRKSVCIGARKSVSHEEINVAAVAAFLQVKVLVSDMPGFIQVHAFRSARRSFDGLEKFSSKHMAYNLKKDVKCQGCFNITTVFSHSQTVVVCGNCHCVVPDSLRVALSGGRATDAIDNGVGDGKNDVPAYW